MLYYWRNEKFTVHGNNIRMDTECKVAKRLGRNGRICQQYNTVYGNNVIDVNDSYQCTLNVINGHLIMKLLLQAEYGPFQLELIDQ